MKRILIACGGTGGHISPGVAILEELIKNKDSLGVQEIYLHSPKRNLDNPDLQNLPVDVIWHNLPQFRWKTSILFPFRLVLEFLKTNREFRKRRIDTVIGMGGYTSLLSVLYAKIFKKDLFLCEQNCMPGKITRKFWETSRKLACSFPLSVVPPDSVSFRVLGNPLRQMVIPKTPSLKNYKFSGKNPINVLVLGGSQGARQINQMVISAMENSDIQAQYKFRVLTGTNLYEEVKSKESKLEAISYSRDMGSHYDWADLVIGRSGAGVLAECSAYSLPMILIPYPFAADNHQMANARYFEKEQAAIILSTRDTDPSELVRILLDLSRNPERIKAMSKASLSLSRINAAYDTIRYFLANER